CCGSIKPPMASAGVGVFPRMTSAALYCGCPASARGRMSSETLNPSESQTAAAEAVRMVAGGAPLSAVSGSSPPTLDAPTLAASPPQSPASTSAPTLIGDYEILEELAQGGM